MAIVSAVGRYLADIFFEPPEDPAVHDVHIVDLADHYRPDFAGETLSHILAAGPYDDTFARRLADLKYHRDRRDVGVFAETLDRLLRAAPEFDYVAVPPSPVLRRISRL